jgi:hypothetical protein
MPTYKEIYELWKKENPNTVAYVYGCKPEHILEALEFYDSYGYNKKAQIINEKQEKKMTREHAIKHCCHGIAYPEAHVQMLEALGLIKFDDPAKSEREKLIDEAQNLNYNLKMNGNLVYSSIIKMIDDLIGELKK